MLFSTRFILKNTVTPNFFCISGTSNSLSDCSKNFKKIYRVENFRANVLNRVKLRSIYLGKETRLLLTACFSIEK